MNQPIEPADTPCLDPVAPPVAVKTAADPLGPSIVVRLLGVLKREPVLFVTLAYLFVSFLGLWSSFWFYRRFDIPILDYMQSSDFFVAGLRRPQFFLLLGVTLFWLWLCAWPMRWVERNHERADGYRRRYWWGKYLFPDPRSAKGLWGLRSETMLVVAFLGLALHVVYTFSTLSAKDILRGRDKTHRVSISLSREGTKPAEASLLGTTSAFVFLWREDTRRTEIVPIESIAKIESIGQLQALSKPPPALASEPAR